MGKKRTVNTFESVSRKIALGYGRGEGLGYKSWFTGHEFASMGYYIRLRGTTIPRLYCFVSELEADAFLLYDSMPDVSDILEQYYLTLAETSEIADLLHIRHPFSGKYLNAVTTDLLVRKGGVWIARAIKSSRDLENRRTVEKLEIERVYFSRRGIDWKIITEKELGRDRIQNLNWLRNGMALEEVIPDPFLRRTAESSFCQLYNENIIPFPRIIDLVESEFLLPAGTGICLFKSLIRQNLVSVDLEKPLNLLDPHHPIERSFPDERYRSYC